MQEGQVHAGSTWRGHRTLAGVVSPLVRLHETVEHSPRCVGGSDEEIDDHSVTHVKTVFHTPETNITCWDKSQSLLRAWSSCFSSLHVTLLPGDDMKHGGDEEQGTQAHPIHPGCDPLQAVVWEAVQQRHAHKGWGNEELLEKGKKKNNNQTSFCLPSHPVSTIMFRRFSCVCWATTESSPTGASSDPQIQFGSMKVQILLPAFCLYHSQSFWSFHKEPCHYISVWNKHCLSN